MSSQLWPSQFIDSQKSKLILIVGMIICWAAVGNANEQWDAKASARVNLRRSPSLSGEILFIIPNGHKVRILQKNGLWCKVEVGGEINCKGWVYAQYLKRILPKALKMQPSTQTGRVVTASEEQKQELQPGGLPPKSRPEVKEVKPSELPLSGKSLTTSVKEQSSAWNELPDTKNELIARSLLETLMNDQPIPLPPVRVPYFRFKGETPVITGKGFSKLVEQGDSTTIQKRTPDEKKNHGEVVHKTVPTFSEQPVSDLDPDAKAPSVIKLSASHEIKGLAFERRSIGPLKIALKLVSIVLYCLVILLLYKGN